MKGSDFIPDDRHCKELYCPSCIFYPCDDGCPCDKESHIKDCPSYEENIQVEN